jgi:chaperonin GroES
MSKKVASAMTNKAVPAKKTLGVKPLMGYILVEPLGAETQTVSGIYLPESAQEKKSDQGMVVAVGDDIFMPDGKSFHSPVQVGEKVIYKKWGGDEVKVAGMEYKLVKFEDLMAILEE